MRTRLPLSLVLLSAFLLPICATPSVQAQTGRGALAGAAGGAVIGGIAGGGRGAAIGAAVGAGTGALIARQGQRRHGRYAWWQGRCYFHARNGRWYRVSHHYCW